MPKENHILEKRQEARGTVGKVKDVKANQSKIHHAVSMLLCIYMYIYIYSYIYIYMCGCKHTDSTQNKQ